MTVSAIITKIQDDRILFNLNGFNAAWFVGGGNLNLHTMYSKGESVKVKIIKQCNSRQNTLRLSYIVIPEKLPVDNFVISHPVGTLTDGIIEKIHGATMTVVLAPNVSSITRRSSGARTGQQVQCKIEKYNPNKRYIAIRVFG